MTDTPIGVVEMQATAHVMDWEINERRMADYNDPNVASLVGAGLLVIVDEETRAKLPKPATVGGRGCNCGNRK